MEKQVAYQPICLKRPVSSEVERSRETDLII